MEWRVYVLFSKKQKKTYVGCSRDVFERLKRHNAARVPATKFGVPWKLVYEEAASSCAEARKKERYFKNASGRRKISDILNFRRGSGVV